jgi:PAS domain S-box-containing protein
VEAEERFRLTMEYSTIGVSLESPEGRFILVNPALCLVLCRDAQALIAATWMEVTHPDDVSVGEGLLHDLVVGTISSFRVWKRYLRPDGSVLWGDLSMSCVRNDDGSVRNFIAQVACRARVKVDEDGTPVAVVGGLVDIEDRKEAEAEEQERLAQLERFQRLTVGGELRMIELKKEIEYLTKYGPVNGREPGDE